MRKITPKGIMIFSSLVTPAFGIAILLAKGFFSLHLLAAFNEMVTLLLFLLSLYAILILEYRLMLKFFPISYGVVKHNSRDELVYFVHALYIILFFQPVAQMHILPTPMLTLYYRLLGTKMGENTFVTGVLIDYTMIEIGSNTLLGLNTSAYCHALEGDQLSHFPIKIGSNVTVGASAIILPGVTIEDDAVVAAGSVVKKGTVIKRGEIWGGVPARFIMSKYESGAKKKTDATKRPELGSHTHKKHLPV